MPFHTPLEQLSFVSLDLETTGLVPGFDAITEIGAARFRLKDGGIVVPGPVFEELVNPEREISQKVAELTGIDDAMVADARTIDQVLPELVAYLEAEAPTVIIAHNARFDMGFVAAALHQTGQEMTLPPAVCTVVIAKKNLPRAPRYGLEALIEWLGTERPDTSESTHHRALPDALHARNLFAHCARQVGAKALSDLGAKRTVVAEAQTQEAVEIPEYMAPLETAIDQGLQVDLNYRGGSKGRSRRPVRPLALFMQNATLYLRATCLVDLQDKSFRADRIRAVHLLGGEGSTAAERED